MYNSLTLFVIMIDQIVIIGTWFFQHFLLLQKVLAICRKAKTPLVIWWQVVEDVNCEEVLVFFHEYNTKSLFSHEFRL